MKIVYIFPFIVVLAGLLVLLATPKTKATYNKPPVVSFSIDNHLENVVYEETLQEIDLETLETLYTSEFVLPVSEESCEDFEYTRGFNGWHNGVDYKGENRCGVVSITSGIVEYAGWGENGEGYMVVVNHGGSLKSKYYHGNGEFYVEVEDIVSIGEEVMQMGCTGMCTGDHVHLVIERDGIAVNPADIAQVFSH